MRGWALLFAGAALAGCMTLPGTQPVELVVSGAPVDAEATGQRYVFETPANTRAGNEGGSAAQQWSMLGREDKAALIGDEYQAAPCPPLNPTVSGQDAVLAHIVEAARKHRVVIINESHTVTRHRNFSRKVLEALHPLGYTVLAAETFGNVAEGPDPVEINAALPYMRALDGWYSQEPVFGAMLRKAKALGYRFAAYEQLYVPGRERPEDWRISIRDRETEQAANLAALIETLGPDEKLIVHVGYAHAREANVIGEDGWDHSWMAARLKRDHGIDPLTIAQTVCQGSADTVRLATPSADQPGWFDMILDHPASAFLYGRPEWRFSEGRLAIEIPENLRPTEGPLVIEAFAEGEPFDAVPVDRVWVEPGEDVRLALPPGRYTLRAVVPAPPARP